MLFILMKYILNIEVALTYNKSHMKLCHLYTPLHHCNQDNELSIICPPKFQPLDLLSVTTD